jgi:Flp pilus assembly pilin Flp
MLNIIAMFQTTPKSFLGRLRNENEGASLIEYTILIAIITVGIFGLLSSVSGTVITRWTVLDAVLS